MYTLSLRNMYDNEYNAAISPYEFAISFSAFTKASSSPILV